MIMVSRLLRQRLSDIALWILAYMAGIIGPSAVRDLGPLTAIWITLVAMAAILIALRN